MASVELEPRHFALMRAIEALEGQSQNALVERLQIPASSMVSLVDHLEERGLVERRVHPTDRRSRTLHVTARGRKLVADASQKALALETELCQGLTDTQRREVIERLQLVARNLGLTDGVHPDVALGHHAPNWTDTVEPR